jgi:hypothetical protein
MGAYPPCRGTPLPYPPLLYVRMSVRGDNPLYNDFKIFGKKMSLFGVFIINKKYDEKIYNY